MNNPLEQGSVRLARRTPFDGCERPNFACTIEDRAAAPDVLSMGPPLRDGPQPPPSTPLTACPARGPARSMRTKTPSPSSRRASTLALFALFALSAGCMKAKDSSSHYAGESAANFGGDEDMSGYFGYDPMQPAAMGGSMDGAVMEDEAYRAEMERAPGDSADAMEMDQVVMTEAARRPAFRGRSAGSRSHVLEATTGGAS